MLFTKTVCKAGSLVYVVPTGLLVTLRYDAHGMLHKVYEGINEMVDLGEDFLKAVVRQGLIPNTIKLHGGTTDIQGVFYSNEITAIDGNLPNCEFKRIEDDILSGSPKYRFYVGNVESGAMAITPASMQAWTKMVGFETLPCWAAPATNPEASLRTFLTTNAHITFEYPLIAGYFVFEGQSKGIFYSTSLSTARVISDPIKLLDYNGYIKYGLKFDIISTVIDYPKAVKFNIQKDSQVVIDDNNGEIIWCSTQFAEENRLPKRITCSSCHKILDVPEDGTMTCSDPFCTSLLYPRISRFCNVLNIDAPSEQEFDAAVKSGDITILPDLLLMPKYKDIKIKKYLSEILLASISGEVGLNTEWLIKFCNKCNNSYPTVKYYFEGPRRITTELDMEVPRRLMAWLNEPRNLVELDTIVNSEQIEIINSDRIVKFDGAPLLRNKTIMITGTFMHGSTEDIIAILQSYSATVVTQMDKKVQCVVVGDIKENIDGLAIQAARELDIPMFDESAFFDRYSIDEDLEKFLK